MRKSGQPFNRSSWDHQIDDFARNHRLIIPDLMEYGETGGGEKTTLLAELALDLINLLKKLEINTATFIELSMGGQVALEFTTSSRCY